MRKQRRLVIVVAIAGSVAGACRGTPPRTVPVAQAQPAIRVVTALARSAPLTESLEAGGVVEATTSADISSRIIAPVMALRVRAGERVRAGDVLVVLDDRDMAARAEQAASSRRAAEQALGAAEAGRAAAVADEHLATTWHTRMAALHARGSATTEELDEAEARLAGAASRTRAVQARIAQAESEVAAARAAATAATTTLGFATVRAPFDGVVTETLTESGNLATPGVPLLRMDASGTRRVSATIDEARASFLRVGDRVEVAFEPAAAAPERLTTGTVTEMARRVAADTRAVTAKIALPKGENAPSGTFARVRFGGAARETLVIPRAAVVRQGQLTTAFVVDGSAARVRLLRLGQAQGDVVEILAGIDGGERVVVGPPPVLADGARIELQPANTGNTR